MVSAPLADAPRPCIRKLYAPVEEEVRRVLLRRFPYSIFYEARSSDVVVLACFHSARDPQEWKERITRE
jgi:plasmid stabilization system protein ParE